MDHSQSDQKSLCFVCLFEKYLKVGKTDVSVDVDTDTDAQRLGSDKSIRSLIFPIAFVCFEMKEANCVRSRAMVFQSFACQETLADAAETIIPTWREHYGLYGSCKVSN